MKTRVIFSTYNVGHNEYIFDDSIDIDTECVNALSRYGIYDCRKIVGQDLEVIAINERKKDSGLLERAQGILNYFGPAEEIFLILHSSSDLPSINGQRQPVGEYYGWADDLKNYGNVRIWALAHDKNERCAFILYKKAYDEKVITADAIIARIHSIFLAEKISNLWKQYVLNPNEEKLNILINEINTFQAYPFIRQLIDLNIFKTLSIPFQQLQILPITRKDSKIFTSWPLTI